MSLGYHAGRIASYTIAGALAGGLGARIAVTALLPLQLALLIAGSVALLVVAASLLGSANLIKRLEPLGLGLWWVVRKIAARLAAPTTALGAVGTGLAWGWIPCGMVYGALPLALAAGSGGGGAIVMLAFGIGTLPAMLGLEAGIAWIGAAGFGGSAPGRHSSRLSVAWSPVWLRRLTGVVVLVFALAWLAHAAEIAGVKNPAIASLAALCAHPLR